ncbi:probable protein S-acyltransferase 15 isoform X3 [Pyrus x bretschneideri]|uniref:probable protein S-acyltransferase 15 isoform X3 n=1 Tax=Pyrus x bretschneideri TaxID=225117 RepID=UPI00202EDA7C|nr:probable protein S-acyltransferase 15 isoform X3 [Pyrus x bretschneideri]
MKFERFLSIPILMVFLLIGVVCYITVFIFIDDWVGLKSSAGSLNALVFIFLASLCLFSFFGCVLTDPGHVPASYVPDVEDSAVSDQESKKSGHCDKCSTYKPPRAHHCRVCRRCVLRMVIIIKCASQKDLEFSGRVSHKVFYVVSGIVMASLSLMLGTLLGWHFYLITHNMTTIEYYAGIRAAWLGKKSGQSYRHPYNLSIYTNITSVLGPNVLKWLCPTSVGHLKDGLIFPTPRDSS